MSEWFWKKLSFLSGWLAIIFLFAAIILTANIEIKDFDLWLHLATGKYILQHHEIPVHDIFSCTIAGRPWINHEWLFQVIVSAVYQWAGSDGLIGLQVMVIGITFVLLLMLGYDSRRQAGLVIVLLLVLLAYQYRFTLRPEIFSLLFLTLYVFVLTFSIDRKWSLWILFFLQLLWSNIHGFFILGPLLIMIYLCGEWIKRRIPLPYRWNSVGRLTNGEYTRLKETLLMVIVACFFNPHLFRGAWYPIGTFFSLSGDNKVFFEHIQELQRPFTWENLFSLAPYPYMKALIFISFFSFVLNRRRLDIGIFILWFSFLMLFLQAVRNVAFFAFAAYLAFLVNFQQLSLSQIFRIRLADKNYRHYASIAVKVILILWILNFIQQSSSRGYYDFDRFERKSEFGGVSLRNYPVRAVEFLSENKISGRFFNGFNSGAYLLGRTFPRIKVFIDGRTEVYGAEFFKEYNKIWEGDQAVFEQAVKRYGLTGAFLNHVYVPVPAGLISYLYEHKDWALVYFDYDAAIFLKRVEQNKPWIDRYAIDLSRWQSPKLDLLKVGLHKVTPYHQVNRAYALFNMKFYDKALAEAQEGMRIEPYNVQLYMLLGKINNEKGEYQTAFENIRKAKLIDPQDVWIRYHLAVALYHLGEIRQAKEQCRRILKERPAEGKVLSLLSQIYAAEQNYELSGEKIP